MGTTGFLLGVRFPVGACELSTKRKSSEGSCDRDDQIHLDDDVNSTMSESSSGIGVLEQLLPCKTTEHQTSGRKAPHGHESDVDSGIVSCQLMDNHTASISSSETDSSRESASNEQKPRPLSDPTQCVRFDEQLHLSEENIRRSCRKLFATLYSHRFSYPCYNDTGILSNASGVHSVSRSEENTKTDESRVPHIEKLKTHSRLDKAKIDNALSKYESQRHHYRVKQSMENASVCNSFGVRNSKEQDFYVYRNPQKIKPEYWRSESNIVHSSPKLTSLIEHRNSEKTEPPTLYSTSGKQMTDEKNSERNLCGTQNVSSIKEQSRHRRLSVDQRLTPVTPNWYDSRKSNSFRPSFPPLHQQNSYSSFLNNKSENNKSLIHKSLSCTVLSTSENLSLSLIPYDKRGPTLPRRTSDPISISSLDISDDYRNQAVERTSHNIPQVTTRNGMVRAYARVVPIISDDSNSYTGSNLTQKPPDIFVSTRSNGALNKKHVSYPVLPNTLSTHSKSTEMKSTTTETTATENGLGPRGCITPAEKISSYKDLNYSKRSEELKGTNMLQKGRFYVGGRNGGVAYSQPNVSETSDHKYATFKVLSNESIQASSRDNVSPYKSMTLNHFKTNGNRKVSKMEYEVLDQSQKNRFNSLPVLDNLISVDNKGGSVPLNSKRGLHQSDFTLYRDRLSSPSTSSSGKSLLDRIQGFTRSAKNAVQKAFSTERIYRPEREERYEAEGQKLKRSPSFIRGLRERMSKKKRREKKKKKMRPPEAQFVTQERLNTSWDEPVLGPGSVTHVEGQLLQLNPDGSQVIELTKPPSKPYGFFVARGRIRNSRGVFVSRMRDHDTEEHLTGLLGIGDEILEIEGLNVKHADILEVNSLMAQRNSLILTVLPYVCRKD